MVIPVAFLHFCTQLFQQTCFRLYGLTVVESGLYVRDQRWKLSYLSFAERAHCWYCGYTNGVLEFVKQVGKETEKMWCPIQDDKPESMPDLEHRSEFPSYGDEQALQDYLNTSNYVVPLQTDSETDLETT